MSDGLVDVGLIFLVKLPEWPNLGPAPSAPGDVFTVID